MKYKALIWFIVGSMIIILYGFFDPARYHFPPCPFRLLTGWLCPGCGSQRAMHQILHGNLLASLKLNLLFLPGIIYVAISFVMASLFPKSWPAVRGRFYGMEAGYISLFVIVVFWVGRNVI